MKYIFYENVRDITLKDKLFSLQLLQVFQTSYVLNGEEIYLVMTVVHDLANSTYT